MEISTYKDNARNKTIFKIEVDNNIEDFEEARDLMFSGLWDSLQKFRAIEQELGIPLEVLFKALKEGVWMKSLNYKDKTISYHKECVLSYKLREWILWIGEYENTFMREVKDYGKTWALTREELENDI